MYLYPQLGHTFAQEIILDASRATVHELVARSATSHRSAFYTATGGNRVPEDHLVGLQTVARSLASANGYPAPPSIDGRRQFDFAAARMLHKEMKVVPADAAKPGVWQFMAAVLLPDVVRWRYPGDSGGTVEERFRGGVRNTFQRLWWRAALLHLPDSDSPYALLEKLNEDELVQIMERSRMAGYRRLTGAVASTFIDAVTATETSRRMDLMRDVQKRILRFSSFLAFEALNLDQMNELATEIVARSRTALGMQEDGAATQQVATRQLPQAQQTSAASPGTPDGTLKVRDVLGLLRDPEWDAPFFKRLAHNDTAQAAGHQAGMVVPKDLRPYLPALREAATSTKNPTVDTRFSAELFVGSARAHVVELRYQLQTWHASRRAESRITDGLQPLRNQAAGGDLMLFQRRLKSARRFRLVLVKQSTEDFEELSTWAGNRKWGELFSDRLPQSHERFAQYET